MKVSRTDKTVVVIGKERRVYARIYKKQSSIPLFVRKAFLKDCEKAKGTAFKPVAVGECIQHGDLYEYHIIYEPVSA